jgi:hypothetical protein
MALIALHGLPGAGKDTAADAISEWAEGRGLSFTREGFSYRMKWSLARVFDPTISMQDAIRFCDEFKRDGGVMVGHENQIAAVAISFRDMLRNFGTEAHRDLDFMGGDDIWLDALLPLDRTGPTGGFDVATIIDVRFPNEAQRIKDRGGVIWEIVRPEITEQFEQKEGRDHRSDLRLPDRLIDLTIVGGEGIEKFQSEIRTLMTDRFYMVGAPNE